MRCSTFLIALCLLLPVAPAADEEPTVAAQAKEKADETPAAQVFTSDHEIRINGERIKYTATAGTMLMKDDEGEPIALFGYTSYIKQGADRTERPLMFAWNGGPGSASLWLHMGVLGPQRTELNDLQINGRGPFRRVSNNYSILDEVDLVMVDPIGTGFSHAVGEAEGKDFWGVDNDIKSVTDFIVQYTTEHGRWASPKYILGESYGGIRGGGVSYQLLTRHSMALNGVVLVQAGYYDLATPYRATEYFIDQLPVPDSVRANVAIEYYEAGHMMYVHPASLAKYKKDLAAFIGSTH